MQYAYDQGRLSALNLNGAPWITAIQYQPFGPVSGWSWADGSTYQNTYDLDGRLAEHPIGPEQRQLRYDPAGNIVQQDDLLPDGQSLSRSYQYDLLGRLIDAQGDLLRKRGRAKKGSYPKTAKLCPKGSPRGVNLPPGLAVQYAYNQGRLSALNIDGEPWITTIQ